MVLSIRLLRSWTTDCWTVFSNSLDSDTDNPMSFWVSLISGLSSVPPFDWSLIHR